MNNLISGSTDGLINIYDLSRDNEDDALQDSLNTESSVDQLNWINQNGISYIGCITHTNNVQLWKPDRAEPFLHFRRSDIVNGIKVW